MKYFIVDAFADRPFAGNPAGVCLPGQPLDDQLMQSIAAENNLAETAFLWPHEPAGDGSRTAEYDLRWFTPEVEIDLCGHATLGSAYVLFEQMGLQARQVVFHTVSGRLAVRREDGIYKMDFPSRKPLPCPVPDGLAAALGVPVLETGQSRDLLVLTASEADVLRAKPNYARLQAIPNIFAVILTARGAGGSADFVSRFFAPGAGIPEDPVTGSSHSTLIPFWSERLGKADMLARQLSARGGTLYCRDLGERVEIGGKARLYLTGNICGE
jgi:PhzF family phenazine biosynthesis protein